MGNIMKRINMKCLNTCVYVFNKDELSKFEKTYDTVTPRDWCGITNGNGACCLDNKTTTIIHEAAHLADWVIEGHLKLKFNSLGDSTELRAYLTEYISGEWIKHVEKGE